MKLWWQVQKHNGTEWSVHESNISPAGEIDATIEKGLPGKKAMVRIVSADLGKVNILITKVGDEPADEPKDAMKKLEVENAALKKELAELKQQLADIKKLLQKKQ